MVEKTHEGTSNLRDNSIFFIGVLGDSKHHNADYDGDDNTGQFWDLDPGRLMPQVLMLNHCSLLRLCMDSTCQARLISVKSG